MTPERAAGEPVAGSVTEELRAQVVGWVSALDACDAHIVVVGHPGTATQAFGPYDGRGALHAADDLGEALDVPVHVVRLHRPRPAAADVRP